jgi:hypothetical protein
MSLQEYVVLPASHSQQDFAKQRKMVPVFAVDCDLSRGTKGDLIIANIVRYIDDSHSTTGGRPSFRFHKAR